MADTKEVYELDLGGNILEQLGALEEAFEAVEQKEGEAAQSFEDFARKAGGVGNALESVDATKAGQQIANLDVLLKRGVITLGEQSEALALLRTRVDDVSDRFKAFGPAGEELTAKLEKIADPVERVRVAQQLWNRQTGAGVKALGQLQSKMAAADAEIAHATGGLLDLQKVTGLAATGYTILAGAAAAAGAILVKVGVDAVRKAAEENVYLRTELEKLEAQWALTQQRLGEAIIGGDGGDAIGFFDDLEGALSRINVLIEDNDAVFASIIPTVLHVADILVTAFSYTIPAALTPLLLLVDSIKFALTGIIAVIGKAAGAYADLGRELGLLDEDQAQFFRDFEKGADKAFDEVGLNSWTEKVWEAGGAVRGLTDDLGDAAQAGNRLVSSLDKLYILQNTELLSDAAQALNKATAEFMGQGIGQRQAEALALKTLPAAQRKLLEDTIATEDARSAKLKAESDKRVGQAVDEQAELDRLRAVEYEAFDMAGQRRAEAAERHYARVSDARDKAALKQEDVDRELANLARLNKGLESLGADIVQTGNVAGGPTPEQIQELKVQYTQLGAEVAQAFQAGAGSPEGIAQLQLLQDKMTAIRDLMAQASEINPWAQVGAQMLDASIQGAQALTAALGETAGAMLAGQATAADFGAVIKDQFISLAKAIIPILLQGGFAILATQTGNALGMIGGALALSAIVGAVGKVGGKKASAGVRYDAGSAQAQFRQTTGDVEQTTNIVAVFGTDQLEPTVTRLVSNAERRGLLG